MHVIKPPCAVLFMQDRGFCVPVRHSPECTKDKPKKGVQLVECNGCLAEYHMNALLELMEISIPEPDQAEGEQHETK